MQLVRSLFAIAIVAGALGAGPAPSMIQPVRPAEISLRDTRRIDQGGGEKLPRVRLKYAPAGAPILDELPPFTALERGKFVSRDQNGNKIFFTPEPVLQARAESLLRAYRVPWGILVALEPKSGRLLTIAEYSARELTSRRLSTRASFPAASLFKVVTAAAAIETAGLSGANLISFRGGNYTLGPYNYLPDARLDRRFMSLSDAMGKSVNPVFARVALNNLSAQTLERYATNFGFSSAIPFEAPLEPSSFTVSYDKYDIARTAAGFGEVFISPLHAALVAAAIGNSGTMPRPILVDRVEGRDGKIQYQSNERVLRHAVLPSTAGELIGMMKTTVETGTARRHFFRLRNLWGDTFPVAAKTGTLSGTSPKGVYHWFIATAPVQKPEIALAALVIDPGGARLQGSGLGSRYLQYYHALRNGGLSLAERLPLADPPQIRRPRAKPTAISRARKVVKKKPVRSTQKRKGKKHQ